jgi:hypothetical protein
MGSPLRTGPEYNILDVVFVIPVILFFFGNDPYQSFIVNVRDEALFGISKHADLIRCQDFFSQRSDTFY